MDFLGPKAATSNRIATYSELGGGAVASVSGTTNRITSTGGTNPIIDISASYVGQTSITTLGTVTSATLNTVTDSHINGVRIGKGVGQIASNTVIGNLAFNSGSTGYDNTAMGVESLKGLTTGYYNIAIGNQAMFSATGNFQNTAIGYQSLYFLAAINGTGINNTVVGFQAALNTTTGSENTVMGTLAREVGSASFDTAIGYRAIRAGSNGQNTGVGHNVLQNHGGTNNTAVGYNAMINNTTSGNFNVAVGHTTLGNNSSGTYNTAVGYQTGLGITTGINNTIIGARVGGLAAGLTGNVIIASGQGTIRAQHDGTSWTLGTIASATWNGTAIGAIYGGTGQTTYATGDILYASAANTLSKLPVSTNGFVLTLASGIPAWVAPSAGGGLTWSVITASQTAAINNGYITNSATLITVTLPSTAAVGSVINVGGMGTGGWAIAQPASVIIHFGNLDTTTGIGGSLASSHRRDVVSLVCTVANTEWLVVYSVGNITIV